MNYERISYNGEISETWKGVGENNTDFPVLFRKLNKMTFGHLKSSLVFYIFSMLYIYICKTFLNVSVQQFIDVITLVNDYASIQWLCEKKCPEVDNFILRKN